MARPKGRNRIPRIINRDVEIDQLITNKRSEDPSFNVSDVDNDLWREYFKMKGDSVEMDLKDIESQEEELTNKLSVLEYKKAQLAKMQDKKKEDKKKRVKDVFNKYKVIG